MARADDLVCRSWVYAPDGMLTTRLVCTRGRGHGGEHEAGRSWSPDHNPKVWVWADKYSEPRQVPR
jgi:hypothetical protein